MAPKKKKAIVNGFSMYMIEMQQEIYEREGRRVPIPQLVEVANPQWKALSPNERTRYNDEAKRYKKEQRNGTPGSGGPAGNRTKTGKDTRMDSTGNQISNRVSVNDLLRERRENERTLLVQSWPDGQGVCDETFCFISFQSLCKLPENMGYLPCELACIEYTLKEGIKRTFHRFLKPGQIPMGYRYTCQSNSENTHQIPVEGHETATWDYGTVWKELVAFINPKKLRVMPSVFCESSQREMVEWCLGWLAEKAGISNSLKKVFEVELLMTELYSHAEMIAHSWTTFSSMLRDSKWDHMNNTRCEFHEDLDVAIHKCALGTCKKYCFHMSDPIALDVFSVTVTDQHLPERSEADGLASIVYPKITPAVERHPQHAQPPPPPVARTYRSQQREQAPEQPIRRPTTDFSQAQQGQQFYASTEPEAPSPSSVPMPSFQWQNQATSNPYAASGGVDQLTRHLQSASIQGPAHPGVYPGIGRGLGRGIGQAPSSQTLPPPGMNAQSRPGANPPPLGMVGAGRGIGRGYQQY